MFVTLFSRGTHKIPNIYRTFIFYTRLLTETFTLNTNNLQFKDLQLIAPILKALEATGYTSPTPIQAQAIPVILEQKDVLGCAQTGTGKTAAFAIPMLQLLSTEQVKKKPRPIRALILTPTRELAIQIEENFVQYAKDLPIKSLVIFGGVGAQPQKDALRTGVDVLIATPGRLLDLYNQRCLSLRQLEFFVLDEADRMLDMGFIHDVRKVIQLLPEKRQTLFFSATMPPEIQKLADSILVNPVKIEVTPESSTAEKINQSVYFVEKSDKKHLLLHLIKEQNLPRVLVFSRTKHGADRIAKDLSKNGISAEAIHGNKSQGARQKALQGFKERKLRVLVATDIAARGIDIDDLANVVNYDLPNIPESYVHRIGRTGRAGKDGTAVSFCDDEEFAYLKDIEKSIRLSIPVVTDHPYAKNPQPKAFTKSATKKNNNSSAHGNRRGAQNSTNSERSRNFSKNTSSKPNSGERRFSRDKKAVSTKPNFWTKREE